MSGLSDLPSDDARIVEEIMGAHEFNSLKKTAPRV